MGRPGPAPGSRAARRSQGVARPGRTDRRPPAPGCGGGGGVMRQFLATLRRRPAPLIGTFVALTLAALLVTATTIFLGTGLTLSAPAQRLAGPRWWYRQPGRPGYLGNRGQRGDRRAAAAGLPARAARPGQSSGFGRWRGGRRSRRLVPGGPGVGQRDRCHGYGGRAVSGAWLGQCRAHPVPPDQRTRANHSQPDSPRLGRRRLDGVAYRVRRTSGGPGPSCVQGGRRGRGDGANPAGDWTVFVSDAEAAALYGHPGQADIIGSWPGRGCPRPP